MRFKGLLLICTGLLLAALAAPGSASSPFDVAEHTPGYTLNSEGQRAYEQGRFFDARHRFERAAYWADKLAQYNLGVIYYRGDGVDRDPARAWAWFELSAERGYPEFVDTAEAVWLELEESGRRRARDIHAELLPRYGDASAVDRTAERMRRERMDITGSRTGFIGTLKVVDKNGFTRDGEDYFAAEKWDFHQIVQLETRLFKAIARGNVRMGEFEIIEEQQPIDGEEVRDAAPDEPGPTPDSPAP
ncbi:MAG: hypothetical protein GVY33_00285 [Alphaproteobacteria bacterium]|jgi:hypothetical protein|nr:hypothetical protein [Alphaproteobacteria bacterium]